MYNHIMIPVDLSHTEAIQRALKTASDLATFYKAKVTYVGVTGEQPSKVAHNPKEFEQKLSDFAQEQAKAAGVTGEAKAIVVHDPAVELDHMLVDTAKEIGADLVVMATHVPHMFDWPSHGGKLAAHADASVMLVRSS